MILFAITDIAGARVIRFPLSADLNADIQSVFTEQRDAFFAGITDEIAFDGRYTPDEDELLTIADFPDVDGLAGAVANPLSVDQFDPDEHSLERVKAIFVGLNHDGGTQILVQLFERRRLISKGLLSMFFSGGAFQKMEASGLSLDKKLLAVIENDLLKFQSFHFAKRVFDLSEFFREATNDEVRSFAEHDKLSVDDVDQFIGNAGPQTRKKISLILQSGVLDRHPVAHIAGVANTMQLDIALTVDGKIVLPSNKTELKKILRFLDEDYYESPLSATRYISNSKRVAD